MKKLLQFFVNTLEPAETYTHTHTHTHTHTDKPCQIKKQIGTICLMLFSFFISPVFATEINNPATCDSGTLSTDTGPTNLRANYESNVLNLKFYDNNTLLDVSSTNSGTCTYGTPINLPTAPTKRGYTFKGWKVEQQYDFTNLNANINTELNNCRWKPINYPSGNRMKDRGLVENSSDLNNGEWVATFGYGTITGMSLCSNTSENTPNQGVGGQYCWCKATGYIPLNNNVLQNGTMYRPINVLPWVFVYDHTHSSVCTSYCTHRCVFTVQGGTGDSGFKRRAFFGQSGS